MSTVKTLARSLMATCSPMTGTRATGIVNMTAGAGVSCDLATGSWLIPVIGGQESPGLVYKVLPGPNSDETWTITDAGIDVDVTSNIGGARHNLADGTKFRMDPPSSAIVSVVANGDFVGGADSTEFGTIKDMVLFEQMFTGRDVELMRSNMRALPGVAIAWTASEPADGSAVEQTSRRTRVSTKASLFREIFQIVVITERSENPDIRSEEGLSILDDMSAYLHDRHSVDGVHFSNPSGVQILRRWMESNTRNIHQRLFIYNISVGCMTPITGRDDRVFNDWNLTRLNVPINPEQGDDNLIVEDVDIDMT